MIFDRVYKRFMILTAVMNERQRVIAKSTLVLGVLPAVLFNLSRLVVRYWSGTEGIDSDFVGTTIGSFVVFLMIGYFSGSRFYSRTKGTTSDDRDGE